MEAGPFVSSPGSRATGRAAQGPAAVAGALALFHAEQLDVELERGVRGNHAAGTARAVTQRGRNDQGAGAADFHARHAFVPAPNDHAGAQREHERIAAVPAGVELGALHAVVVEPARVVDGDAVPLGGLGTVAGRGVVVLQAGSTGNHLESLVGTLRKI